jgi:hypothetical protein
MLMLAHDLAQTTPHPVAHDCATESPRCNKAGAETAGFFRREHAKYQQPAAMRAALLPDALKFRRAGQAPAFWKRKRMARRHIKLSILR